MKRVRCHDRCVYARRTSCRRRRRSGPSRKRHNVVLRELLTVDKLISKIAARCNDKANEQLSTGWQRHRIKISNRRATQRCNVSAFFYAKICSLLARRRSSQPVQRVYWPENVIDWLGKWRPTCVMRHARGQKLQSFRRKWPFYMNLYSMAKARLFIVTRG